MTLFASVKLYIFCFAGQYDVWSLHFGNAERAPNRTISTTYDSELALQVCTVLRAHKTTVATWRGIPRHKQHRGCMSDDAHIKSATHPPSCSFSMYADHNQPQNQWMNSLFSKVFMFGIFRTVRHARDGWWAPVFFNHCSAWGIF